MPSLSPHEPRGLTAFVGRDSELCALETALRDSLSGSGRLVLVGGEPGIGKSRLCEEFTALARELGSATLYGRCHETEGAPAFSPWVRALGAAVRSVQLTELRAVDEDALSCVAQLVPSLRERLPDVAPLRDPAASEERVYFFDGVARFLAQLALPRGLVLVLDDLHGADRSSVLLLEFLARQLSRTPVLVVGTYRTAAVTRENPLAAMLATIEGVAGTQRLTLKGLGVEDVSGLVEQRLGFRPPASLVTALRDKTEGNPLFVAEYLRLLAAQDRLTPASLMEEFFRRVPARVQVVIAWRLAPLSENCKSVLRTAAVIGRDFRREVLERAAVGRTSESVEGGEALAEAIGAGVVTVDAEKVDGYRFAHALIRETLYEQMPAAARSRMHREVGQAIEQSAGASEGLAELAHHFCAAGGDADLDKGVDYAVRAGEQAMALLAYEEAVHSYRVGLTALGRKAYARPRTECELLLALGNAEMKAGDPEGAKTTLLHAAALARRGGWSELLAQAALDYGTGFAEGDRPAPDPQETALLEEALRSLPAGDSIVHARLHARLALTLVLSSTPERAAALSVRAVEMAQRIGDPSTLAFALHARRLTARPPAFAKERLADVERVVELARSVGDRALEFQAHLWISHDRLELGDAEGAESEAAICARLAEESRQPAYRFHAAILSVGRPLREGRWLDVERLVQDACNIMPEHITRYFLPLVCQANACLFRGGAEMAAQVLGATLEHYPNGAIRAGHACYLARTGRGPEARREIELLATNDFANLPAAVWTISMCLLADASVTLGDKERAAKVYELLLPCGSLAAVMGVVEAYWGPVAHYLGILAAALERWEVAERHFEQALEMNRRFRAWPWLAETQYEYARMLLARDRAGDAERSEAMIREVLAAAQEIEMPALLLRVESLRATLEAKARDGSDRTDPEETSTQPASPIRPAPPAGGPLFLERGDHWTVVYDGVEVQLKDSKGLRYLAHLVRHPRREIAAPDLAEEVGRASGTDRERPLEAGEEERARSAVTKRIKAQIKRIAAIHPALGRHLAANVSTGHRCRYEPEGKSLRRLAPVSGGSGRATSTDSPAK